MEFPTSRDELIKGGYYVLPKMYAAMCGWITCSCEHGVLDQFRGTPSSRTGPERSTNRRSGSHSRSRGEHPLSPHGGDGGSKLSTHHEKITFEMRSQGAGFNALGSILIVVWVGVGSVTGWCEELALPDNPRDSVIGEVRHTRVQQGESLLEIARAYDIGHDQIILANPHLNRWVPPPGSEVTIPSQYIIPPGRRDGIVINLSELRLYFFPPKAGVVHTFPISIGDLDWRTPLGTTKIIAKTENPSWSPPKSIKEEHLLQGEELPDSIPGGDPENPLGQFALKLGIPGYLIHGTNDRRSFGIGMRVSHGCIRLYPENMERLFELVKVGTSVRILDQSVKVGWLDNSLFVEIHHPLELRDEPTPLGPSISDLVETLESSITRDVSLQTRVLAQAYQLGNGIPTLIGTTTGTTEELP